MFRTYRLIAAAEMTATISAENESAIALEPDFLALSVVDVELPLSSDDVNLVDSELVPFMFMFMSPSSSSSKY